ncbi:hypothetical protein E0H22_05765 [Rhodopseudomonas boonkerdii]|uniref:hypothetical protein n=1 Tax=Rhodopseudomonas boonkerdii TaxID=475937 RepID=UPI001E652CC9|nr:hypothetical protein [Rhodopseudomonas boonkerdii]UGV25226.1 hypothetical protein E0H22_05765 [Rhodopseudomonas boonkerdii]
MVRQIAVQSNKTWLLLSMGNRIPLRTGQFMRLADNDTSQIARFLPDWRLGSTCLQDETRR